MNTLNPSPLATPPTSPNPSQPIPAETLTIPASNFTHHRVSGDGDCLFRAAYMGLANQPGLEPDSDQVALLRQGLANYVYQYQHELAANPAFEGTQGVYNLNDLLLTRGQWNHNAGDLVAPLLAQVFGRTLAILQPAPGQQAYDVRQVFPPENPSLPPAVADTGEPPIYLAHVGGNHYEYLEQNNPEMPIQGIDPLLEQSQTPMESQNSNHGLQESAHSPHEAVIEISSGEDQSQGSHRKDKRSKLSSAQKDELAQIWQNNPKLTHREVIQEFNQRHPGLGITQGVTSRLKLNHPDLKGLTLGYSDKFKKHDDSVKDAMLELWRQNPRWGEKKITQEFKKRNPSIRLSRSVATALQANYPDIKDKSNSIKHSRRGKLSAQQEKAMAKLWQQNPSWGISKLTTEFNKQNPGLNISTSIARKMKSTYEGLKDIKVGGTITLNKNAANREQVLAALRHNHLSVGGQASPAELMQTSSALSVSPQANGPKTQYPNQNITLADKREALERELQSLTGLINQIELMEQIEPMEQISQQDKSLHEELMKKFFHLQSSLQKLPVANTADKTPQEPSRSFTQSVGEASGNHSWASLLDEPNLMTGMSNLNNLNASNLQDLFNTDNHQGQNPAETTIHPLNLADIAKAMEVEDPLNESLGQSPSTSTHKPLDLDDIPSAMDVEDLLNENRSQSPSTGAHKPFDLGNIPGGMDVIDLISESRSQSPSTAAHKPFNLDDIPSAIDVVDLLSESRSQSRSTAAHKPFDLDDIPSAMDVEDLLNDSPSQGQATETIKQHNLADIPSAIDVEDLLQDVPEQRLSAAMQYPLNPGLVNALAQQNFPSEDKEQQSYLSESVNKPSEGADDFLDAQLVADFLNDDATSPQTSAAENKSPRKYR